MSEPHAGKGNVASEPVILNAEERSTFHAALRERTGKITVWTAAIFNVLFLAWTGFDYFLAPEQWVFFLELRVAAVLICTLAALFPAWWASRLRPVDALRHE